MSAALKHTGSRMPTAVKITALVVAASLLYSTPAVATAARPAPRTPQAVNTPNAGNPLPTDFANEVMRLIGRIRYELQDPTPIGQGRMTHRVIGLGDRGTRNWGLIGIGRLADQPEDDVQLVFDPEDLYIRGIYRRFDNTLYHYAGADIPDALFPPPTAERPVPVRRQLPFRVNYLDLPNITVDQGTLTAAVETLRTSNDTRERGALRNAIELMAVTFAETARNRLIQNEVFTALRGGGTWRVGGHDAAMKSWNRMGDTIRTAEATNAWETTTDQFQLDGVEHGGQQQTYSALFLLGVVYMVKRR
ncbi:ribosome-inactivating family protein [Streptomyces violascens]|uniref:ribosome-inactivating family protein n=1 Tax=Streptomyces violascens TaxID=67381 RepID=UPI0036C17BC3